MIRLAIALTIAVFTCDGAWAQTEPATSIARLLSFPFPDHLVASKTGAAIAWTLEEHGLRNIYLAVGPAFTPRRLTSYNDDDGRELTDLSFSDDGKYLVYVRGANRAAASPEVWSIQIADGAAARLGTGSTPAVAPRNHRVAFLERGQLWIAPIDGSAAAQPVYVRGVSESLAWSPDGATLAFASNRDSHGFITLFTQIDRPVQYVAPSTSRDSSPVWSPDGARLAFVREPGRGPISFFLFSKIEPWAIWVSDIRSGASQQVWRSGPLPTDSIPDVEGRANLRWGADDRLVFLSYEDGWPHLYSVSAAGGRAILLTPGASTVDRLALSPDLRTIVFSANGGTDRDDVDRRHVFKVPVDAAAPVQLTNGRGIEWGPVVASDGTSVAYFASTPLEGPRLAIQPIDGVAARQIGGDHVPPDFAASTLVAPETVVFAGKDGTQIHGQVFKTSGSDPRPALVFVHDGPAEQTLAGWPYSSNQAFSYELNQYFASRGFLVLSVNYRSGIGYGHGFQHGNLAGVADYDDILSSAMYLQSRQDVDPKRLGIWGAAYGGYLTAVALARNSNLFAAGVDVEGSPDLTVREIENLTISVGDDCAVILMPLEWTTPALIVHGDDDGSARFRQSEQVDHALSEQGAPIEVEVVPGDTSQYLKFSSRTIVATRVAAYFERLLKPAAK